MSPALVWSMRSPFRTTSDVLGSFKAQPDLFHVGAQRAVAASYSRSCRPVKHHIHTWIDLAIAYARIVRSIGAPIRGITDRIVGCAIQVPPSPIAAAGWAVPAKLMRTAR